MNPTIEKFGYPKTLIADYPNWVVLLRPAQATLGALVLAHKSQAEAFSDLDAGSFAELGDVVRDIEAALAAFRPYRKINYLMLMMVDPQVHFHVLPRYDAPQSFGGAVFEDKGWPKLPDLGGGPALDEGALAGIAAAIKDHWPA
jgi:diadenosine tetraphosphate (Ap4A) HIT family hydrolase